MHYNILLDSTFKDLHHWEFINCKYENGWFISTEKVFGIKQELVLPDITKLYFRCNYIVKDSNILDIKIGIQNGNTLEINRRIPRANKEQSISVVENAKQEKITVHLIFESKVKENKVHISKPILYDLNFFHKSTWLKAILDKTIKYRNGYSYLNELNISELTKDCGLFNNTQVKAAKIGSIIDAKENTTIPINIELEKGKYYLVKLDYEEINKFGKVYFKYGSFKSIYEKVHEQAYLLFKANNRNSLELIIEQNGVLDYLINLKHIMIVDITKLNIAEDDIAFLPFI